MAIRKLIFINTAGDYEEHITTDSTTDDLKFRSLQLVDGAAVNAPSNGGASIDGHIDLNAGGGEGNRVINMDDPIDPQDGATKAYVDATATGLDVKDSVSATSISAAEIDTDWTYTVGNEGPALAQVWDRTGTGITVDSISFGAGRDGEYILIKSSATPEGNGIFKYIHDAGGGNSALARRVDFDGNGIPGEVSGGAFTFVEEGATMADTGWVLSSPNGVAVLGTDPLLFTQFSSAGIPVGGNEFVTKSGNIIEFTELDEDFVVIGDTDDGPTAVDTNNALVVNSAGTPANHIKATVALGMVIKPGAIEDEQVGTSAEINTSKIELVSHTPIVTVGGTSATRVTVSDSLQVALNKIGGHLDILNADLGNGGAAEIGFLTDTNFATAPTTLQDAVKEARGVTYTTDGVGVDKGDAVFMSGSSIVSTYTTLTDTECIVGLASQTIGVSAFVQVTDRGVLTGVLTGATPGDKYYWDGSAITLTIPSGSGSNVWQVGYAKNATDLIVNIKFINKNS